MKTFKYLLFAALSCTLVTLFAPRKAAAQLDLAGEILRAGADDTSLLFKEYIRPFAQGFGADLNSGWFSSAKPNDDLRLDIMIRTAVALVPKSNQTFLIDDIPFIFLDQVGGPQEVQTAFGAKTEGAEMGVFGFNPFTGERQELGRFTLPGGTGYPYVPAPIVQVGLGVGVDTEFIIRFVPPVRMGNTKVGTNGFGIKHSVNQWLPGGDQLPVDLSLHAGFSQLSSDVQLDVQPDDEEDIYNPFADRPGAWDAQSVRLEAVGFSGTLLVGKTLSNVSLFGGIGIQTSRMNISTPGGYPITTFNLDYDAADRSKETRRKRIERIESPVSLEFKEPNALFGTGGVSLDYGLLTVSGAVSYSNYTVLNIGVGLNL